MKSLSSIAAAALTLGTAQALEVSNPINQVSTGVRFGDTHDNWQIRTLNVFNFQSPAGSAHLRFKTYQDLDAQNDRRHRERLLIDFSPTGNLHAGLDFRHNSKTGELEECAGLRLTGWAPQIGLNYAEVFVAVGQHSARAQVAATKKVGPAQLNVEVIAQNPDQGPRNLVTEIDLSLVEFKFGRGWMVSPFVGLDTQSFEGDKKPQTINGQGGVVVKYKF